MGLSRRQIGGICVSCVLLFLAIGGGISGSIQAPTGKVGTVMAINGAITSPTIYGQKLRTEVLDVEPRHGVTVH